MFATTRMALLIGGAIGGATFPLFAQETTKNDTVIVTSPVQSGATKLATPDIETPQSVSIITRQQFEEQGATSVRQAVSYTPGVYSNQIGASNRFDYIVLRGFSDGSLDNVYLDGLKMMGDTNSHSSLVVDPWFLEDIEVVRGPASVLYGRSSPGGIVALTSRKPAFDAGGEVKLFAGNHNQRGAAFDVTGPLDDNERVAARLSGMTRYADSQFTPLKEERYALMPSLTWRITDRTRLDLMAYLHRDPEGGSHSGLPYQGTVVPYNGGKISNTFFEGEDDYDKYDRRENMVGYNIEHLFDSGWSVRQKLRYLHTKVTLNQVYAAGWLNETALNRGYSGSGEKMSAIALDNQLDGSVDTGAINHRLLVGIDYQDRSNHTTGYYGAFPPIDAFNPFMALSRITLRCIAVKNISCGRPDTIYRIRCHGIAGALRWAVVTIGSACLTSTNFMIHAAISIKTTSAPVLRCFICSTMASPPISVILPRLRRPASPTKTAMCWNR